MNLKAMTVTFKTLWQIAVRMAIIMLAYWCIYTLISCSSDSQPEVLIPSDGAIHFSTEISGSVPVTRAYDATWETNDAVGIFMTTTNYATTMGKANAKHIATKQAGDSWNLVAETGNELYYPASGDAVSFIGYYPYSTTISALTSAYTVTLGVQSATKTFDLLYYKKAETFEKGDQPTLQFNHQLSKIIINVKRSAEVGGAQGVDISGMTIKLTGTPKTASFNLSTGVLSGQVTATDVSTVNSSTPTPTWERTHQAVIIPHAGQGTAPIFANRTLVFTYKDIHNTETVFTYTIPTAKTFMAGKAHTYNFTVEGSKVIFVNSTIAPWDNQEAAVEEIIS